MLRHANRPRRRGGARPRLDTLEPRCLLSAGDLDPTFNRSGMLSVDVQGNGSYDKANAAAIQVVNGVPETLVVGWTRLSGGDQPFLLRLTPAGALDPTFAGGGKKVLSIGKSTHFNAVTVLPNGSFFAVGDSLVKQSPTTYDSQVIVAKFTTNGSPDTTFGNKGVASTNLNPGSDIADGVAVQPDGKIVVVGLSQDSPDGFGRRNDNGFIARYNAGGALDGTFGSGGVAYVALDTATTPTADRLGNVAVQTDATGAVTSYTVLGQVDTTTGGNSDIHAVVVRLTPTGARMAGWGSVNGRVDLAIGPTAYNALGTIQGLAIDQGGRVVVAGNSESGTFAGTIAVLTPQGALDTTFADGDPSVPAGYVRVPYPTSAGFDNVAIDASDRIVVSGLQQVYSDAAGTDVDDNIQVFRFLPTGQWDTTFGAADGGYGLADATPAAGANSNEHVSALALQPDGKVVVVGMTAPYPGSSSTTDVFVARFQGDSTTAVVPAAVAVGTAGGAAVGVVPVPPGEPRPIAAGPARPAGARALRVATNFGYGSAAIVSMLQPDGKVVAVGSLDPGTYTVVVLARSPEGSLDTAF
jgi:uncharacterized delta-60 repeat protein